MKFEKLFGYSHFSQAGERNSSISRQNGWGNMSVAGAGAAYWAPGSRGLGAPLEKARRYLGTGVSNNIA